VDAEDGCSTSGCKGLREHWFDFNVNQYIASRIGKPDVDDYSSSTTSRTTSTTGSTNAANTATNATNSSASTGFLLFITFGELDFR